MRYNENMKIQILLVFMFIHISILSFLSYKTYQRAKELQTYIEETVDAQKNKRVSKKNLR